MGDEPQFSPCYFRRDPGQEADIKVWRTSEAPRRLREKFGRPLPGNSTIITLSAEIANDMALEAAFRALVRDHLVSRRELEDGGVALLYSR